MSKRQKKRKDPASYRKRSYRALADGHGLRAFEVRMRETDLHIMASRALPEAAMDAVLAARAQIENHIVRRPQFMRALAPLPGEAGITPLLATMYEAAARAGVGPMAAVAGAIAEFTGRALLDRDGIDEVVVENGGDIFLWRKKECVVSIFAADSPLSRAVGLRIAANRQPIGVCTSSATVGHSLSLGRADAVTVLAADTALADAAATRIGNEVKESGDFSQALRVAESIPGIDGVVIIKGDRLGAWGDVELTAVSP